MSKNIQITAQHLGSARDLLAKAKEELKTEQLAVDSAFQKRSEAVSKVGALTNAFGKLVAGFQNGEGIDTVAADSMPKEVQGVVGYTKELPAAPEPPEPTEEQK